MFYVSRSQLPVSSQIFIGLYSFNALLNFVSPELPSEYGRSYHAFLL